ncbi:MAG: D-2-hydroxyacid dehydrogenase [Deltaproteobacteria bacterium]|nr:D-2-hydroxyacid dehydrogenase [Deltaproteobacteria bacterium]
MKVVVLDGHVLNPGDTSWAFFEALADLTVYPRTPPELTLERIGQASYLLLNKTRITREILERAPNIKYIGVLATGYDVVDIQAARERGVVVTNIPGYGTNAVSQYAIGLLLEICLHIGRHGQLVREGRWSQQPDFCFWEHPLRELTGLKMGIIGLGRIGLATAAIAKAMGMEALVDQAHADPDNGVARLVSQETLWSASDVISLHCPLNESTYHIVNEQSLSRVKKGVILINTARGDLVDEAALATALKSGQVGYAGLDVVSQEPISPDNPLLGLPNCLITPHVAGMPREARQRVIDMAYDNFLRFLEGTFQNVVTSPNIVFES